MPSHVGPSGERLFAYSILDKVQHDKGGIETT